MRRNHKKYSLGLLALLLAGWSIQMSSLVAQADTTSATSLGISQLKITSSNGQFIALYNMTNAALDMSKYSLEYFNSYDLTKATSSKIIALSGMTPPHGYYIVSDDTLTICYQTVVDSVSLGLSSTAGFVELVFNNQSLPGSSVIPVLQDYIGWSKTAVAGAQTLPTNTSAFLQRLPLGADHNPAIAGPGAGSWQAVQYDPANACNLIASAGGAQIQLGDGLLLPAVEPVSTVVAPAGDTPQALTLALPAADVGLMAPLITELLPNPSGTGNDTSNEYVELYNPNDANFDLTGFKLSTGLTNNHSYVFPAATLLGPKSFKAFYSAETGLSLSNTSGQSQLFDPAGKLVASAAAYGTAADGQSWSLSNGQWFWSTHLTPSATNIIEQPVKSKSSAKTSTTITPAGKVAPKTGTAASSGPGKFTIHSWAIVMIVAAAILYWAYEYRTDIADRGRQLASYFRFGDQNRQSAEGRRGD